MLKKSYIQILLAANMAVAILGFAALRQSPYIGIEFSEEAARIVNVDDGGPADLAGIKKGDKIAGVNGTDLPDFALALAPTFLTSNEEINVFWKTQRRLYEDISTGRPLDLAIERDGERYRFSVTPLPFPFTAALGRSLDIYLVLVGMLSITYLIIRKKENETTIILFLLAAFIALSDMSCVFEMRDIVYPYYPFRLLSLINISTVPVCGAILLHFSLVFPRRKRLLEERPSFTRWLYAISAAVAIADVSTVFGGNILGRTHFQVIFISFPFILLYSFFTENDPLYRRQIKWIVFGLSVPVVLRAVLVFIPRLLWGNSIVDGGNILFIFSWCLMPASIYIAFTRYRLMDIDDLIDSAVIYGLTITVLAGAEMLLLGSLSNIYGPALYGSPFAAVPAVLLIVFIYLPVRNAVKRSVEKMFKRGSYDTEDEAKRFVLQEGVCGDAPVLERFSTFVRDLLGPSGVCVIEKRSGPRVTFADGEKGMEAAKAIAADANRLCEYFKDNRRPAYGFELTEKGILIVGVGLKPATTLDSALFVPVFVGNRCRSIVIFFEKWNRTPYSKKDRSLCESLAINIGHILHAEEMKRAKEEAEAEHRRQREHVMKEMHDGLGSILTNITVASRIADSSFEMEGDKAKEMVGVISRCSVQATDFLRTGLTILDNQEGELGPVIKNMRHRLGGMLQECGIGVNFEFGEGVEGMKTDAVTGLNMVRSVQEAFNNIMKHSGAEEVSVRFSRDNDKLKVEIEDNGKGFDLIGQKGQGYGLMNMAKRMEGLGGTLEINSSPGKGTRLEMVIPQKYPGMGMEMPLE